MKRAVIICIFLLLVGLQTAKAQCYLNVQNSSNLDTKAITQISLIQISQHFESVDEIPPEGVGSDACIYTLSVSEISNGILVTIKGRKASTYGDSKLRGFDGFQHALFRAIISSKPEQREPICRRYSGIMGNDCAGISTPSQSMEKGKLIVRVPDDYRYAQIMASGRVIGEMGGDVVKEFQVNPSNTLVVKAVDGSYQSEELYAGVQPNTTTRLEFKDFQSTQQQSSPTPEITRRPRHETRPDSSASSESEFAGNGAFVFGWSFVPAFAFKDEDIIRDTSGNYSGTDSATGFSWFVDIFASPNFGIGTKFITVGTENTSASGSNVLKINLSNFLFTATLWFPLSTRNKGYSHFGITGGAGSATYQVTSETDGEIDSEWEATGTASMYGAFFDWGGEIFGGRLGYYSLSTKMDKLERVDKYSSVEFDVDGTGSAFYVSMRWAWSI